MVTPSAPAPMLICRIVTMPLCATMSAHTTAPRLKVEYKMVKTASVLCRLLVTKSGSVTLKLYASVPIAASIAKLIHKNGVARI